MSARNSRNVTEIHNTPVGSPVLFYQPRKDLSNCTFSFLALNGEDATVLLPPPSGPTKFRVTVGKRKIDDDNALENTKSTSDYVFSHYTCSLINDGEFKVYFFSVFRGDVDRAENFQGKPCARKIFIPQSDNNEKYEAFRVKKYNILVDFDVVMLVPEGKADGHRIFQLRFVDKVKNAGRLDAF